MWADLSVFAFGVIIGCIATLLYLWFWSRVDRTPQVKGRHGKPRRIPEPDFGLRTPDLPTNTDVPPSRITQARFRARRETRD